MGIDAEPAAGISLPLTPGGVQDMLDVGDEML